MSAPAEVRGLLATLAADGEAEARLVLDRARDEAGRIALEAQRLVGEELERRLAVRARQIEAFETLARLEARADARRSALLARRAVVNRVMSVARRILPEATTAEFLRSVVDETLQYIPDGEVVVRCAEHDLRMVKQLVAGRRSATVVSDPRIGAGVTAETPDGTVSVDGTLDSRLGRMHDRIAIAVVSIVEGAA